MTSHKFKLGDRVRLVKLASTNTVEAFLNMVSATDVTKIDDTWEITRLCRQTGAASSIMSAEPRRDRTALCGKSSCRLPEPGQPSSAGAHPCERLRRSVSRLCAAEHRGSGGLICGKPLPTEGM